MTHQSTDRFRLGNRSLRQHAARGTLINSGFDVGIALLELVRGFVVAAFLTRGEYGVWGILVVSMITLFPLLGSGIGDKFVQQDEPDQRAAFEKAFTIMLILTAVLMPVIWALLPLLAILYGRSDIIIPGVVLSLAIPAGLFQAPVWVYYRRMAFVQQRSLQAVAPVVAVVVSVGLAIGGLGYWSLVLGTLIGGWAGALVAVRFAPYPLRLRYDRGALRSYTGFSWPLFTAGLGALIVAQGSLIGGEEFAGIAGAGAIALAASISLWTDRVDHILTRTLYPAICAVRHRTELLFESFVKSNRLTLMWGMPFGVGLALFGPDLVHFALGEQWVPAITLIQAFGLAAALNHVGFNWDAYFRATGNTRPMAVYGVVVAVVFVAVTIPMLASQGLNGFVVGLAAYTAAGLAVRVYYLTRLFPLFRTAKHMARAIAPTVPAVASVLAIRLIEDGGRTAGAAAAELMLYLVVTGIATVALERQLLREALGYLRGSAPIAASGAQVRAERIEAGA
jgi:O-antigen/teichoic acid export membrane protein